MDSNQLAINYTIDIAQHRPLFIILGIGLLVLGILAITRARAATQVTVAFFGWLMLFGGILAGISSFFVGNWSGFFMLFFIAVLTAIFGFLLLTRPLLSAEAITIAMAFYYLVSGIFLIVAPLFTHTAGWGWLAVYGLINVVLGAIIFRMLPEAGLFIIGLFIGIDLAISGVELILLAVSA